MDFGKRIQELRKKCNLSQEELADKIGVARQTISKWELNETSPDLKQAKKLSKIFDVSLDELVDNREIRSSSENSKQNNFIKHIGLFFTDLIVGACTILFFLWVLLIGIFSIACLVITICLFVKFNIGGIIPYIPYWCGFIFGIALIGLCVLSATGCYWFWLLLKRLVKQYVIFHYNVLSSRLNQQKYIQIMPTISKRLKNIIVISLVLFIIFFITTIIVCMISSNSIAFWHTWNWWV